MVSATTGSGFNKGFCFGEGSAFVPQGGTLVSYR